MTGIVMRLAFAAATLAAAQQLAPMAAAQERPLELRLRSVVNMDDNVFRLPESAADPQAGRGISGKGDRFTSTSVALMLDKSYWQQRLQFELARNSTRYDKFSLLNFDGTDYRGTLQWRLTPHLGGTLSTTRAESLVRFEDTQTNQRVLRVVTSRGITVDAWLFGGWHLLGGASEGRTVSSQVTAGSPDSNQTGGEFGIRYIAPSQSSITAVRRMQQGSSVLPGVPILLGSTDFKVRELELSGQWLVSGRSTLTGRVNRSERSYESFSQGNFTGVSGDLGYAWTPTGRLTVNANIGRAVVPFFFGAFTHRNEDSFAVTPVWRASEKTTVRLRASRQAIQFLGAAGAERRDTISSLELGGEWLPHRRVVLSASLRQDRRSSTDAAAGFQGTVATATASVNF